MRDDVPDHMNTFVTQEWVTKEALEALRRSAVARGLINRQYDVHYIVDWDMPTFDHIPTEIGRAAAKRLWCAAGRPVMKDAGDV